MKKRYLVTGAAGFIGSRIAAALLQRGCEVVTIDNLSTGKRENVPDGCVLIEGDVFARKIIDSLEQHRFDGILHIAGQSSGEVSFDDPVYDLQTNAQSTIMQRKQDAGISCMQAPCPPTEIMKIPLWTKRAKHSRSRSMLWASWPVRII